MKTSRLEHEAHETDRGQVDVQLLLGLASKEQVSGGRTKTLLLHSHIQQYPSCSPQCSSFKTTLCASCSSASSKCIKSSECIKILSREIPSLQFQGGGGGGHERAKTEQRLSPKSPEEFDVRSLWSCDLTEWSQDTPVTGYSRARHRGTVNALSRTDQHRTHT